MYISEPLLGDKWITFWIIPNRLNMLDTPYNNEIILIWQPSIKLHLSNVGIFIDNYDDLCSGSLDYVQKSNSIPNNFNLSFDYTIRLVTYGDSTIA